MKCVRVRIIISIIKNSPRYGEQILRKLSGLEGIIGHQLTFLNKKYGSNDKVYDKINSKPSSTYEKDI